MWRPERWRERDALSAYWNARVRSVRGERLDRLAAPLDPTLTATVTRVTAGRQRILPDPQFVARLERDLRRDFSPAFAQSAPLLGTAVSGNGVAPLRPWTPPVRRDPARLRQLAPLFATALLLLVTLGAVYVAFVRPHQEVTMAPIVIPAATPATPDAAAAPVELVWRIEQPWGIPAVDPGTGNVWIPADFGSYAIISPDGELVETWGTRGSGEGEFDFATDGGRGKYGGSVFDPAGNFYVVDNENHRIQKFGPDRAFLTAWGSEGEEDGQFLLPREIAIDAGGLLYVTDEERNDVQVFDGAGAFLRTFGSPGVESGQFSEPAGVAIDRDGNVWIGDYGNQRIQKFTPEGAFLGAFGNTGPIEDRLGNVFGVAASADGYVFVPHPGADRVHIFDTAGNPIAIWGHPDVGDDGFEGPSEVVFDGQGNLYISDGGGDNRRNLLPGPGDNLHKFRILLPPSAELTPPAPPAPGAEGQGGL